MNLIDGTGRPSSTVPTSCCSLPSTWLRVKRRPGFSNALAISSLRHRASLLASLDRRVTQTVLQRIERSFETGYPSTNPLQHIPVDQLHLSILLPWQRIMVPRPLWVSALVSSVDLMANPILEHSVVISQYGTPQIIAWRLRDSLEYIGAHRSARFHNSSRSESYYLSPSIWR